MSRFKAIVLAVTLMLIPANLELSLIEASLFDVDVGQVNFINVTIMLDGGEKGTD